ncbi:MAG: zinc ABC transporter substrate-binding protein [Bacilli bacterium]|nr:zinc ABC transporter substrate-binding protein [Bacilli bacterium]
MKKLNFCILLILSVSILNGCSINKDNMEDIDIYTTIYPIKYLINSLYGENSTIYSIYPSGVDTNTFELSEKKIEEYSNTDLFVFNSLDRDRDFAVKMINMNKNLKVIDVSLGMTYDHDIAELWLNPYNYLMMAQNTKDGLLEYVSNPYLISNTDGTGIEDKYEELRYDLSRLDADMKENISLATYKTIVVDNDMFKFLEKYDLRVISLEENDSLTDSTINEVKKLINTGQIRYIYSSSNESNETVKGIINSYNVELVTINTMQTIDGGITNSNENYITVMNNNLDLLNKELYK